MNMRFTLPDSLEGMVDLHPLRQSSRKSWFDRERLIGLIGLVVTAVLHVVLLAAFIYGGIHVAHVIAPEAVVVSIEPLKEAPPPPPAPPPLIQPQVETVTPPDVTISIDTPPPITVQAMDKPVIKVDPPQPVAAETQASYLARVLAHLNSFKRYPSEARRAKIQGVVMLHFVMNKAGTITAFDIAKSSGRPALDAEALALVQRAQPLPAIPPGYGKDSLNAIVPIEFTLH